MIPFFPIKPFPQHNIIFVIGIIALATIFFTTFSRGHPLLLQSILSTKNDMKHHKAFLLKGLLEQLPLLIRNIGLSKTTFTKFYSFYMFILFYSLSNCSHFLIVIIVPFLWFCFDFKFIHQTSYTWQTSTKSL